MIYRGVNHFFVLNLWKKNYKIFKFRFRRINITTPHLCVWRGCSDRMTWCCWLSSQREVRITREKRSLALVLLALTVVYKCFLQLYGYFSEKLHISVMKYWRKKIVIFSPVFAEIFSIYVLEAIFNFELKSYSLGWGYSGQKIEWPKTRNLSGRGWPRP